MAKDGTARGGPRVGAGRKPKALADKVAKGMQAEDRRYKRGGCAACEGIHEGEPVKRDRPVC